MSYFFRRMVSSACVCGLFLVVGCGDNGTNPPVFDGAIQRGDGGPSQCTGGPCCDVATGTLKKSTAVCLTKPTEYRCFGNGQCGSGRQRRAVKQHCSGVSQKCDGRISPGSWVKAAACGATQRCAGAGKCSKDSSCAPQCTSGSCCNTATSSFLTGEKTCATQTEVQCTTSTCASQRRQRTATRKCTGKAAGCTGAPSYSTFTNIAPCAPTERCAGMGICAADPACTISTPTVAASSKASPRGTTIKETGYGFSKNGAVTLYFRYPDGKINQAAKTADAKGEFTHSFATTASTDTGTYEYWAIDAVTSVKSNMVKFAITINPNMGTSSSSGKRGVTFNLSGADFTPGGTATLFFKSPGGATSQVSQVVSASGAYSHPWITDAETATGVFQLWAVDKTTGIKSNAVQVTVILAPTVSATPATGPRGTVFSEPGTGFTPWGTVTQHFQYPSSYVVKVTKTADANGDYIHTWTTKASSMVGTYNYWTVDNTTGIKSNTVQLTLTP